MDGSGKLKEESVYRMVMDKHICPYGLQAKDLLEREGSAVDDHWLTTCEETDAFKREYEVESTPQVFIGGDRIGGYDMLQTHLGHRPPDPDETTYIPVRACVGGASNVPLGFVSLTENLMMIAMALWMGARALGA